MKRCEEACGCEAATLVCSYVVFLPSAIEDVGGVQREKVSMTTQTVRYTVCDSRSLAAFLCSFFFFAQNGSST